MADSVLFVVNHPCVRRSIVPNDHAASGYQTPPIPYGTAFKTSIPRPGPDHGAGPTIAMAIIKSIHAGQNSRDCLWNLHLK
ncbi:MAG: hypothetical protein ACLVJO_02375 [[Clostridium] scindens]